MPTKNSVLSSKSLKLSDTETVDRMTDKQVVSVLTKGDIVLLKRYRDRVNTLVNTLTQDGEGEGKRISGAADHSFEAQATALGQVVTRGNIAKIA